MGGVGGIGISDCNYCYKFISGGLLRRLRYNFLTVHPHAVSKRLILADTILERTFFLPMGIFLDVMCFYTCAVSHGAQSVGSMSKRDEPEKSTGHFLGRRVFLHMCSQSWNTERRVNEQKRRA